MNKRIDYAAEAERDIQVALEYPEAEDTPIYMQAAQAKAMLALAEQQRIANLLAAVRLSFGDGESDITKPWDTQAETQEWRDIRDEIVRGLGL